MKNVKFKLNLKEINTNSCDIQAHFENAQKLLDFLNKIARPCFKILKNKDEFFAKYYNFDIRQEASLFQEISNQISKADFFTTQCALWRPCYWSEIYDFFEFSEKQKDEIFSNLNYYIENVNLFSEKIENFLNLSFYTNEGIALNDIYDLSSLIVVFKNFDDIVDYLKKVKKICKIPYLTTEKEINDVVSIQYDDDDIIPF